MSGRHRRCTVISTERPAPPRSLMAWLEHQDLTSLADVARAARTEHDRFTTRLHLATRTPVHHRTGAQERA